MADTDTAARTGLFGTILAGTPLARRADDRSTVSAPAPAVIGSAWQLNRAAGVIAASVLIDSATEHYRGDFHNPVMVTPLVTAAASIAVSVHGLTDAAPASVFATVASADGIPDGAGIDREGGYWCALHGGGRLRRYRADGSIDREIPLSVSQPTMRTLAGDDLATFHVTSASDRLTEEQRADEPHADALLRLDVGARGIARASHVV